VTGPAGGDTESRTAYVRVEPPVSGVTASFIGTPTSGLAPLTVSFVDQSVGDIDSWSWDFGDGSTSDDRNPVHVYESPGQHTVALTVSGPGTSDTMTRFNYIDVESTATDFDADGDVDLDDFSRLQACYTGPGGTVSDPDCEPCDVDGDGDVDGADFGILDDCFSGALIPNHPACGS
jgi:PKD repeat protein